MSTRFGRFVLTSGVHSDFPLRGLYLFLSNDEKPYQAQEGSCSVNDQIKGYYQSLITPRDGILKQIQLHTGIRP